VEKGDQAEQDTLINGYKLRLLGGVRVQFGVPNPSAAGESIGEKQIPQDAWTFVAAVCDGSTLKVYVNGVLDHPAPYPQFPLSSLSPMLIGSAAGRGGLTFNGGIDDVRVYNRALTANEIARLAEGK